MEQRSRAGAYRDPHRLELLQVGRRHVLVVEGHDVAAVSEALQRREVVVPAQDDIVDDLGRWVVRRSGKDTQPDPEGRCRRSAHPRQLPSAHDADPWGALQIHGRNLLRG
jgi:hypothetical protein